MGWHFIFFQAGGISQYLPATGTQSKVCVKHPVRHPSVVDGGFGEDGRSVHLPNDQGEQEFYVQAALIIFFVVKMDEMLYE